MFAYFREPNGLEHVSGQSYAAVHHFFHFDRCGVRCLCEVEQSPTPGTKQGLIIKGVVIHSTNRSSTSDTSIALSSSRLSTTKKQPINTKCDQNQNSAHYTLKAAPWSEISHLPFGAHDNYISFIFSSPPVFIMAWARVKNIFRYLKNLEWNERVQHVCKFCGRANFKRIVYEVGVFQFVLAFQT